MRWCLWKFQYLRNRFVSRVPTHTSTWNQGIDVEDFGILNTKLGARTIRGQRIQVIIRVGFQLFFG